MASETAHRDGLHRDGLPRRPTCGENFLYGFKGAQSAPRALVTAHAEAPREIGPAVHGASTVVVG